MKLGELARNDVSLLNICGSLDFCSNAIRCPSKIVINS